MTAHSKLSPSAAHRWLMCPGSVALSADCPDESSEHAREGTAAHELAAKALRDGNNAAEYIGYIIVVEDQKFTVDKDMASYVQVYLDTVRDHVKDDCVLLVEQRVGGDAATSGTADAIVLDATNGAMYVIDLKYGQGKIVSAQENPQTRIYSYHALRDYEWMGEFLEVHSVIVQPRTDHTDSEVLTAAELCGWYAQTVEPCVTLIETNVIEPDLVPGDDQCRWCPAKAKCPALAAQVMGAALQDFAVVSDLTEYGLAGALEKLDLVKQWVASVEAAARAQLEAGLPIPGWQLVEGRQGNRKWKDETAVEAQLKAWRLKFDEMYKSRLISPTEAEKMLSAKRYALLGDHIERGAPVMKIVRGTSENTALKDFENIGPPAG